jgi:NAD(P)-dependent dehydrogenase (short-subunit alcohol dehydrogenase family)
MKNKIIIVTGGSGLLGKAMLNDLRLKGATAINFDIKPSTNRDIFFHCNIIDDNSIREAIGLVVKKYKKLDGFINNAYPRTKDWGVSSFENIDHDSWRTNVDWQLNSYFVCCQEVIKIMLKQKNGSIVNIASTYGVVGNDFTIYEGTDMSPPAAYSAIKGGIINFTRYLASKYGEKGIRINCVSPGGIFDQQSKTFVKAYEKKVPMKRMGKPEDIAPGVSFLLSDEARYITGQNLIIDGGWTAI